MCQKICATAKAAIKYVAAEHARPTIGPIKLIEVGDVVDVEDNFVGHSIRLFDADDNQHWMNSKMEFTCDCCKQSKELRP